MFHIINTLNGQHSIKVTVLHDADCGEYQVCIEGSPDATYHTDGLKDALSTAQWMLADAEVNSRPLPPPLTLAWD